MIVLQEDMRDGDAICLCFGRENEVDRGFDRGKEAETEVVEHSNREDLIRAHLCRELLSAQGIGSVQIAEAPSARRAAP